MNRNIKVVFVIQFLQFNIFFCFYFVGKYYLVDASYPKMSGYLGPYKGKHYHLLDF